MTERLASPLYSRSITSELLFEAYNVPSVAYGVDSLFAFEGLQARRKGLLVAPGKGKTKRGGWKDSAAKGESGLVINMGHMSTTLIPVLDGKSMMNRAKRYASLDFLH
jgi:actin-related protein 5